MFYSSGSAASRDIDERTPLGPGIRSAARELAAVPDFSYVDRVREWRRLVGFRPVFSTRALAAGTWSDFAQLAEDHHGVWAGCWCLGFHEEGRNGIHTPEQRRALKEARVRAGRAHAALVFDGAECVGWCQFGSAEELPRIKHQKAYREGLRELPDWRITCFFVGRGHRHRGVADAALAGALEQIAELGGGTVESYPEDTAGRKVSASFLNNGTLAMFERHGFTRGRQIGKHRWIVTRVLS